MNREETANVLRVLHAAYRTEITSDMEVLWHNLFATNDASLVMEAAIKYSNEVKDWFPTPAAIREYMRAIQSGRRAIAPRSANCDGSGWIEVTDRHSKPCPNCNPALSAIWSDHDKRSRYLNGARLSDVSEDVMVQNGVFEYVEQMPLTCGVSARPDDTDPYISPSAGRSVASAAYAADCEARGVAPDFVYFDRAIGGR